MLGPGGEVEKEESNRVYDFLLVAYVGLGWVGQDKCDKDEGVEGEWFN